MTVFLYFDHINVALASIRELFQKILPNPNFWILVYVNIIKRLCYLVSVFLRLKCRSVCFAGWGTFAGGAEASAGLPSREHTGWAGQEMWAGSHREAPGDLPHRVPEPSGRRQEWRCEPQWKLGVCSSVHVEISTTISSFSLCRSWSHVQSCVTDHRWIGRTKETSGDAHL